MQQFLEKLRNKPAKTRKRYALGTSVSVSGLIFVMWLTVMSFGPFSGAEGSLQNENINQTQTASPLSAFSDNALSAFQEFRDQVTDSDTESGTTSDIAKDNDPSSAVRNDQSATVYNNSPEAYWDNQNSGEVNGTSSPGRSESSEGEAGDESFTSRNYNPNQESDWFDQ